MLEEFVVAPLLVLLLLFTNDRVTMSIASDNARPSISPNYWSVAARMKTTGVVAFAWLIYSFGIYEASPLARLPQHQVQTLDFVGLAFSVLANVLMLHERSRLWQSRPGTLLLVSSAADVVIVAVFASFGIFMNSVSLVTLVLVFVATLIWVLILDAVKVSMLGRQGAGL